MRKAVRKATRTAMMFNKALRMFVPDLMEEKSK